MTVAFFLLRGGFRIVAIVGNLFFSVCDVKVTG